MPEELERMAAEMAAQLEAAQVPSQESEPQAESQPIAARAGTTWTVGVIQGARAGQGKYGPYVRLRVAWNKGVNPDSESRLGDALQDTVFLNLNDTILREILQAVMLGARLAGKGVVPSPEEFLKDVEGYLSNLPLVFLWRFNRNRRWTISGVMLGTKEIVIGRVPDWRVVRRPQAGGNAGGGDVLL